MYCGKKITYRPLATEMACNPSWQIRLASFMRQKHLSERDVVVKIIEVALCRRCRFCSGGRPVAGSGGRLVLHHLEAAAAGLAPQHLHFIDDDLGVVAILRFLCLPLAVLRFA